jgi:hypothetical protein
MAFDGDDLPPDKDRGLRWTATRYERLLPLAGRSRAAGRAYATLVAAMELRLDAARRATAERRIARWLGVDPAQARRVYRDSLRSEAREEADCAYFMAHPEALDEAFRDVGGPAPDEAPTIYAILHFGAPILAYLRLCRGRARAVHVIARELDASNPMPEAKRRFGIRKVAWVREVSGLPFFGVDGSAVVRARERLLAGESLYAAFDVPGDVAQRAADVTVCGERLRLAAGITTLASLTRTPVQPVLALSHGGDVEMLYGPRIPATSPRETLDAAIAALFASVVAHPGEWWLWPYVTPAP